MSDPRIVIDEFDDDAETVVQSVGDSGSSFFDRQERIAWWDQECLYNARVLVVGAGALGNEVLKNLALLGVGYIAVIDFDHIEDSNLSRAVLFRVEDATNEASKALVAAKRAKAMNPYDGAVVKAIHGDVVWDLGAGVFRHVDLVLGCLDNLEARIAVNRGCWQTEKVWIDGGLWELSGSVAVYDSSADKPCYDCHLTKEDYERARLRYSCSSATMRANIESGREPTTQTSSAVVGAIQTQEAIKLLHGLDSFPGSQLVFNGLPHFYFGDEFAPISIRQLTLNPDCECHQMARYVDILPLLQARATETTARQLIAMVEAEVGFAGLRLQLDRDFIVSATCPYCERAIVLNRPIHRFRDVDVLCPTCAVICPSCGTESVQKADCPNCKQQDIYVPKLHRLRALSVDDSEAAAYLDHTLYDLGIPPLHILALKHGKDQTIHVELAGDIAWLMSGSPAWLGGDPSRNRLLTNLTEAPDKGDENA